MRRLFHRLVRRLRQTVCPPFIRVRTCNLLCCETSNKPSGISQGAIRFEASRFSAVCLDSNPRGGLHEEELDPSQAIGRLHRAFA